LSILTLIITFFVVNSQNSQNSTSNSFLSSLSVSNSQNSLTNSQNSSLICKNLNRPDHDNWKKVVPENGCPYLEIGSEFSSKKSNSTDFSSSAISNLPKTETQIYTNEFLPNFKLNYPEDWKMETTTKPTNIYQNILRREIILTKNNSKMIINLGPIIPTGCSGGEEIPALANLGNFKRYKVLENPYNEDSEVDQYYYSKWSICNLENRIKSSIKGRDAKEKGELENSQWFKDFVSQYETIDFILSANLESNSQIEIKEADEIIKNSVLE